MRVKVIHDDIAEGHRTLNDQTMMKTHSYAFVRVQQAAFISRLTLRGLLWNSQDDDE